MDRRYDLHDELVSLGDKFGVRKVLFQPPPTVQMEYPAIVYTRKSTYTTNADNRTYKSDRFYQIQVIDPNPDTPLIDAILNNFQMIKHVNNFKNNNLNYDMFDLYY